MPADLSATRVDPLDPLAPDVRKARLGRLDRRYVDAHAAHADRVHVGQNRVRRVLVDVDDAAAARHADLTHRVEQAGVVATVGARLHEHVALDAEVAGEIE